MTNKLWTRDFTTVTLGTVVSMLGSAMSGFAISLLVLDCTGSTFLFALFNVMNHVPNIVMPALAGPYLDQFSRRRILYSLNFLGAGVYLLLFFILDSGYFNYVVLLLASTVFGVISSVYSLAYDSFYPNLISKGNFSKAYSVSSMIYPLAAMMMPVAAIFYDRYGAELIFLINAVCFFVAAVFETQIQVKEKHTFKLGRRYDTRSYAADFREGLRYIASEKGLLAITAYFCAMSFCDGSTAALMLPYFKDAPGLAERLLSPAAILWIENTISSFKSIPELLYGAISVFAVGGRLLGGWIHYRNRCPANKKFAVACVVYAALCFLDGTMLFLPLFGIIFCQFLTGILGVTSFNIRISATQSYIPDSHRARFNGVFSMIMSAGMTLGQLAAGGLAELMSSRAVIAVFCGINLLALMVVMSRRGKDVKLIYNREV